MNPGETPEPSRRQRFWQRLQGDDRNARVPRGVIAVVAIGIFACIAAPALTHLGSSADEFAHLFWVQQQPIPDSKPVAVPGSQQKMQLVNGGIRATGTNVEGYSLFRVLTTLKIEKGAPIAGGNAVCSVKAAGGDEIAHSTRGLRATYPRSSEDGIYNQEVPEEVQLNFASHGHKYAILEVGDLPSRWTTVRGVKLEWPEYEVGTENLDYELPPANPEPPATVELPFYTIWRTQKKPPAAKISCALKTSAGEATVKTSGALAKTSPPIDEEAEEETQEAKEESEEGSAAEESTEAEEGEE
jgi:hypothetical protein